MPTPSGVNYLLQFLYNYLENLPIFENKNLKADIHPICPYIYFLAHRQSVFRVQHYYKYVFLHFREELLHKEFNGFFSVSVDSNSIFQYLLLKQLIHILP